MVVQTAALASDFPRRREAFGSFLTRIRSVIPVIATCAGSRQTG